MRTKRTEKPKRAKKPLAGVPALLPRYRRGELTADEFLRATSTDFERMAVKLMRGWDLPSAVDEQDVAQELRQLCLKAVEKWDATRGVDLARYAIFHASDRTKRWMTKQRGASRAGSGPQPSRYPLLLIDACEREEREGMLAEASGWRPPNPEDAASESEREKMAGRLSVALGKTVEQLTRQVERDPELRAVVLRMITGEMRPRVAGAGSADRLRVFADDEEHFVEWEVEAARPRRKMLEGALS